MNYLLGIDFGGGASKATLLSERGEIVRESTVEYPTCHPTPDACEQRSEDWIEALCKNCRDILENSGIAAGDILAVAVDSATHSFLPCDAQNRPLRPAVHWTDSRSRAEADRLLQRFGDRIFALTFHQPDTIWTLPQLCWLQTHEAEVFRRIRRIFFEKDYIRFFLTGSYCTDRIEAQGSMLFDCTRQCWSEELCALAGIDASVLPPIVAPTDLVGSVTAEAASATGLLPGTPVICGTTDTAMEVFASGAVEKGDVTVKLATAGRICIVTDRPYPDRHLVNYSHIVNGLWYPGSATKAAASSYRWYRDTFGSDYPQLNEQAQKIPVGAEGLLFHPYINGELTPLASPMACGSFVGVRSTHTKAHFTRAVLEGVSLSLLDSKRYLEGLGIAFSSEKPATLIGGGAKGALWAQITADILGLPLRTTRSSDSSLGSAMLAGMAVGVFRDAKEAAQRCVAEKSVILPDMEKNRVYADIFEEYKEVQRVLVPLYEKRK